MDPLTALGAAAAIVQLVDVGTRVVSTCVEIHESIDGLTRRNAEIRLSAHQLSVFESKRQLQIHPLTSNDPLAVSIYDLSSRCTKTADKLLDLVEKLKIKSKERSHVFRSILGTFKTMQLAKEISLLQTDLSSYTAELDHFVLAQVQAMIHHNFSVLRKQLQDLAVEQRLIAQSLIAGNTTMDGIKHYMDGLSRQLENQSIQLSQLKLHNEQTDLNVLSKEFLTGLKPPTLNSWQTHVRAPEGGTFEWLLEPEHPKTGEDDRARDDGSSRESQPIMPRRSSPRPNLVYPLSTWLESDSQLYWISGKAGSGKSTLMHMLSSDETKARTVKQLQIWSRGASVILSAYYFWKASGDEYQTTVRGMLQTLLYNILGQSSTLTLEILERENHNGLVESEAWTQERLWNIIKMVLSSPNCPYILFLIDGLDEIKEPHTKLVNAITELQRCSVSGHVKICVSSRLSSIFSDAFKGCPHMKLEDITEKDIYQYTKFKIQEAATHRDKKLRAEELQDLVTQVVRRAQGVFIWVKLVLEQSSDLIMEGASLKHLQTCIDDTPQEIEDFYKSMLKDLKRPYQEEAALVFALALHSSQDSLAVYALLDLEFTLPSASYDTEARHLLAGAQEFIQLVRSRCCGLLEIVYDAAPSRYHPPQLERREQLPYFKLRFIHRTAADFAAQAFETGVLPRMILHQIPMLMCKAHFRLVYCAQSVNRMTISADEAQKHTDSGWLCGDQAKSRAPVEVWELYSGSSLIGIFKWARLLREEYQTFLRFEFDHLAARLLISPHILLARRGHKYNFFDVGMSAFYSILTQLPDWKISFPIFAALLAAEGFFDISMSYSTTLLKFEKLNIVSRLLAISQSAIIRRASGRTNNPEAYDDVWRCPLFTTQEIVDVNIPLFRFGHGKISPTALSTWQQFLNFLWAQDKISTPWSNLFCAMATQYLQRGADTRACGFLEVRIRESMDLLVIRLDAGFILKVRLGANLMWWRHAAEYLSTPDLSTTGILASFELVGMMPETRGRHGSTWGWESFQNFGRLKMEKLKTLFPFAIEGREKSNFPWTFLQEQLQGEITEADLGHEAFLSALYAPDECPD